MLSSEGFQKFKALIGICTKMQYVMRKQWFCVSAGTPDFTYGENSIAAFLLMLHEILSI